MKQVPLYFMKYAGNVVTMFILMLLLSCSESQTRVLPAHAHNDYEHRNPLSDALGCRFKSVEADVYSIGDSLFVAHDSVDIKPGRTLRRLYLDPLRRRIAENGGSVYGEGTELFLFVDIKDDAVRTYKLLHKILADYSEMLTCYRDGAVSFGNVRVIISGNRPLKLMQEQPLRYAFYDGRMNDLDSGPDTSLMPVVSDNWNNYFTWHGQGEMPEREKQQLTSIMQKARGRGCTVRFWATPDQPGKERTAVWTELKIQRVGLIGTDDLNGLKVFLSESKE
ncbi:MAG: phosphatidylinositol-specific phospholipase C/glycerophosphodiester phosphodiesterase family protein [Mangrovibacterium sp.]